MPADEQDERAHPRRPTPRSTASSPTTPTSRRCSRRSGTSCPACERARRRPRPRPDPLPRRAVLHRRSSPTSGAEVVKVESPKGGDEGRYGYPTADGVPVVFLALNRDKKGITLDLRQDEGRALLRRLLPHFDVLVENFAGGTLARWGLAPEDALPRASAAHRRQPVGLRADRAVGARGPRTTSSRRRRAASCRSPASRTTRRRAAAARSATTSQGLFGAIGVLAALARARAHRPRAGGRRLEPGRACSRCSTTGRRCSPRPAGCRRASATATWRRRRTTAYRARDGWVVIAVASNKLFRALAAAIGRPELGDDERFRGVAGTASSAATRSTASSARGSRSAPSPR